MKAKIIAVLVVFCAGMTFGQQGELKKSDLKGAKEKVSYSIGLDIGKNLKKQAIDVDPQILIQGIKDAVNRDSLYLLTESEIQETMQAFQKELYAKQTEKAKMIGEKNKKDGEACLAENKKQEGVKTTASGLQYKVIKAGKGASPKATDKVVCHYKGTLVDGTEFDNSYKRGEPATFPVTGVIKGWTEALQMMKTGDKWELTIPSSLGYGEQGAGQSIGPNAVLKFEVELISIVDPKADTAQDKK